MTASEMADKFIQMFGDKETAYKYALIWQDEYITEEEKQFRKEVKNLLEF